MINTENFNVDSRISHREFVGDNYAVQMPVLRLEAGVTRDAMH